MKTARYLLVLVTATAFLLAACGGAPPAPVPAATEPPQQPTAAQPTTPPLDTASVEPTVEQSTAVEPTQPQYAPFCNTSSIGCEAPTVTMIDNKYCIEKVPYAIMSVAAGTNYETSDPDFQCVDQMHSDGTLRVTCHSLSGKQLWSYDLKVCNSACSAPALQMGTGQCQAGYGYDPTNQCCAAPPPASGDGCTVYKVDLGACPEPQ